MSYNKHSEEQYKGINIEINYSQDADNPFESWDGCIPLITLSSYSKEDYSKGDIIDYLRSYLTYNQVKRNQTKLLDLMAYSIEDFKIDYPLDEFDRTEQIQDSLLWEWLDDCMENKSQFCKMFNIKHYATVSRGYSQGDWADVFMCWTPNFEKITGRSYESMNEKDFEDGLSLFSNWAWGNVFYFYIEESNDSCGGFYEDNFEENGLLEMAKESIDSFLNINKKVKENKLKDLIKNNVPLLKRKQILEVL